MRDIRIVNMTSGQLAEAKKVFKRIGEMNYRNLGVLSKICLFDSGSLLITSGLTVSPYDQMSVTVNSGKGMQKIGDDIFPFIQVNSQIITFSSASGSARTDIIEAQIRSVEDKDDTTDFVIDSDTGDITVNSIKRDIKYLLNVRSKTNSGIPTAGTSAYYKSTVSIPGTIDLSIKNLICLSDGEDGSFYEINIKGATAQATTKDEIVSKINSAIGRNIATISGNYIVLTGNGIGEQSCFEFKPPISDIAKDAIEIVFGLPALNTYSYYYLGTNPWVKIAEVNIGATTTVITSDLIKDISKKNQWSFSDGSEVVNSKSVLFDNSNYPLLYPGKIEWFDDYINASASFPFLCLSDVDKTLSISNWPLLVPYLRNKPLRYMPGTASAQTAFNVISYSITSNVATLTFSNLTAENAILSGLVEDQLVHGSYTNWRTITLPVSIGSIAARTYAITAISASSRTVSFTFTASNVSSTSVTATVSFYPHRLSTADDPTGTQARHFQMTGRTLVSINDADGECIAGLRRRDRGQGHCHSVNKHFRGTPNGENGGVGTAGVYTTGDYIGIGSPTTDGVNGDPRTGRTTDPRSLVAVPYICGGQYVA